MVFLLWPKGMLNSCSRRLVLLTTVVGAVMVCQMVWRAVGMRGGVTHASTQYGTKFCVLYDYWRAAEPFRSGPFVTLVLHTTGDYLSFLEEQLNTWTGPVSVAMFIASPRPSTPIVDVSESQLAFKGRTVEVFLSRISRKRFQAVFAALASSSHLAATERISLHLFFVRNQTTSCPRIFVPSALTAQFSAELDDLHDFRSELELYPINTARNIARKGTHTELFISGDIEQFYVPGFERRMFELGRQVLLENKEQTVLVHRRFELADKAPMPKNKSELSKLWQNGTAVEFHRFLYSVGHHIPFLMEWFTTPELPHARIQQQFRYFDANWEPQFVGDQRVPLHWEKFPYRYMTNAHLGSLLCYRNFSFSVIHDVFSVHRGIQRELSMRNRMIRTLGKQLGLHKPVARYFQRMLQKSAPEMISVCPRIV